MPTPKFRSHPLTSRGLSPTTGNPWLTIVICGTALLALARLFLFLEQNWRATPRPCAPVAIDRRLHNKRQGITGCYRVLP